MEAVWIEKGSEDCVEEMPRMKGAAGAHYRPVDVLALVDALVQGTLSKPNRVWTLLSTMSGGIEGYSTPWRILGGKPDFKITARSPITAGGGTTLRWVVRVFAVPGREVVATDARRDVEFNAGSRKDALARDLFRALSACLEGEP